MPVANNSTDAYSLRSEQRSDRCADFIYKP